MMVSVDRYEGLDGDELDRVSDLPSLPGSRKTSEQMRKLSGKSFLYTQSPLLSLTLAPWMLRMFPVVVYCVGSNMYVPMSVSL